MSVICRLFVGLQALLLVYYSVQTNVSIDWSAVASPGGRGTSTIPLAWVGTPRRTVLPVEGWKTPSNVLSNWNSLGILLYSKN